jgi:hypothetical protein
VFRFEVYLDQMTPFYLLRMGWVCFRFGRKNIVVERVMQANDNCIWNHKPPSFTSTHYRNLALPSARRFVECNLLDTRQSIICRVSLSTQTSFPEGKTLGIERHSAKKALPNVKLSVKC